MRQRSTEVERVKRLNRAVKLLKKSEPSQVIERLGEECGISRPQAYRYVQEAGKLSKELQIPEGKEAVIVKLPVSIIKEVRRLSRKIKESISGIITEAISVYLKRHGAKEKA